MHSQCPKDAECISGNCYPRCDISCAHYPDMACTAGSISHKTCRVTLISD